MEENNRLFFNQLLESMVMDVYLWENFDDKDKRRLYGLTGQMELLNGRWKFHIRYLKSGVADYKTVEEMFQDYVAVPRDLIEFGKSLGKSASLP